MTNPKPIPVKEAARIGREFEKSAVIVIGWEPATQLTHVATWGASYGAKAVAAAAGERISKMLTGTELGEYYEDFRRFAPDHALILDLAAHLGLSCEQTTEGILREAVAQARAINEWRERVSGLTRSMAGDPLDLRSTMRLWASLIHDLAAALGIPPEPPAEGILRAAIAAVGTLHALKRDDTPEDAALFAWLSERFLAADFAWGDPPEPVLVFRWPATARISADLRASLRDAVAQQPARAGEAST